MRNIIKLFFAGLLAGACWGQNAAPMPTPKHQFADNNGKPLNGGCLYSFAAGTSTPLATYTTSAATTPNTNPLALDSAGRAGASGSSGVFLGPNAYKLVLTTKPTSGSCPGTPGGTTLWTEDNIQDTGLMVANIDMTIKGKKTFSDDATFQGNVATGATVTVGAPQSLAEALALCSTCTLRVAATVTASDDATIPATIQFEFVNGGSISVAAEKTVTFTGPPPAAGPYRIFSGGGLIAGLRYSRPEWFGATGDGTTDDLAALNASLAALAESGTWEFVEGQTYAISGPLTILERNGLTIRQNRAWIKRTGTAGKGITLKGVSYITWEHPWFNGGGIATDCVELQSDQAAGGQGTSFISLRDLFITGGCTNSGIRFGNYSVDSREDAVDRTEVVGTQIFDAPYEVMVDSPNAADITFMGKSHLGKTVASSSPLCPKYNVYALSGRVQFHEVYTTGDRNTADTWAFYIRDAEVVALKAYAENGYGGYAGFIYMDTQTPAIKAGSNRVLFPSAFYSFNGSSGGYGATSTIPVGTMIYQAPDSRQLQLYGCSFNRYPAQSIALAAIDQNAGGIVSVGSTWGTTAASPFGPSAAGGTMGPVRSVGDQKTNYTTITRLPDVLTAVTASTVQVGGSTGNLLASNGSYVELHDQYGIAGGTWRKMKAGNFTVTDGTTNMNWYPYGGLYTFGSDTKDAFSVDPSTGAVTFLNGIKAGTSTGMTGTCGSCTCKNGLVVSCP